MNDSQQYLITDLDAIGVVNERDFLQEGLGSLNESVGTSGAPVSWDTFVKTTLMIADAPDKGFVRKFSSINGKPLAFMVAYISTPPFKKPNLLVYAYYSNNKSKGVTKFALEKAELWARAHELKTITTYSYRMSGAAFRLFESIWGFTRTAILFSKSL